MATAKIIKYYEDDSLIIANEGFLPSKLSDLTDDATHRTVTDTEKGTWNAKEDASNKSNDIATDGSSTTKYPSVKAIKDYADSLVIGLTDLRGEYNASVNTFPATGGSGTAGAILKGDVWLISVEGTLGGVLHKVGDAIIAISDTPGQTAGNWGHLNSGLGFVPENVANKKTTLTDSDTDYPTTKAVNTGLGGKQNTIGTGDIKANMLQTTATDLGAADITIDLGNTNGSYVTNLTTDGTITATAGFSGNLSGNAATSTTAPTTALVLDQTTPQTVINGRPVFNVGLTANDDIYGVNINYNEGLLDDPTITDATGVAIAITSVDCLIRSNSTWDGDKKLYKKTIAENTALAVTDDSINYIYVTWNSGTPIYASTTNRGVLNNSDAIPVARVYMSGGNIEYQLLYQYLGRAAAIRNFDRVMRIRGSGGIERESGLALSETATRVINIESGVVWFGLKRVTSSTLGTIAQGGAGVTSHLWYHSSGNWTETDITQYNNCFDEETELLTDKGFVKYTDIIKNKTKALTINTKTSELEYNNVKELFIHTDKKQMIRFSGRTGDILVTPEHRMIRTPATNMKKDRKGKYILESAEKVSKLKNIHLVIAGESNKNNKIYTQNEYFFEVLGLLISDGYFHKSGAVHISQRNIKKKVDYIENVLNNSKIPFSKHYRDNDSMIDFYIKKEYSLENIKPLLENKYDLSNIMDIRDKNFFRFIAGAIYGDGNIVRNKHKEILKEDICKNIEKYIFDNNTSYQFYYAGVDKKLIDNISQLCLLNGLSVNIIEEERIGFKNIYRIRISNRKDLQIKKVNKEAYNGVAWCVAVENETLVLRRKGIIFFAGNTQYDNGTNLATLTTNRYAVNWVFRNITTDEIDVVLGRGDYTLAQAEASTVPPLPEAISNFYVLCGRIIVKKSSDTAYVIENVSTSTFNQSTVSSHPDLSTLTWTTAGHTGTASTIAGFLASTGVATEYTLSGTGTQLALTTSPTFTTPVLGTPTSGTLTNCTGLPISGLTASTSTAIGVGSIELGHASDTTITRTGAGAIAVEGVNVLTVAGGTMTGALNIEHADGIVLGKDEAGGGANIAGKIKMFSSGDDAYYNTFTSGDNTANATYTLPTAMPAVTGYVLSCTDAGVMSWDAAGGFSWGASASGTTTGGLTLTLSNNSDASAIAESIVVGNTQANAVIGQKIDLGTSAKGHTGLLVNAYNVSTNSSGIKIDRSTTGNGYGINIVGEGGDNSKGIYFSNVLATTNSNFGIVLPVLVNGPGTGNGIYFGGQLNNSSGTAYGIKFNSTLGNNTGAGYGIYFSTISEYQNSTNQIGIYVNNLTGITKSARGGKFFSFNEAKSDTISNYGRTIDTSEILHSRTNTSTSGTCADNFNIQYLKRTSVQNGAGGTFTSAGSVLKLENVATQTAGTLTDSVTPLLIVQDADSTGAPISVTQNAVVSTNFKKLMVLAGVTIWMSDGTTAEGALSGTEGDICFNGGTGAGQAAFCDSTGTNWTDM